MMYFVRDRFTSVLLSTLGVLVLCQCAASRSTPANSEFSTGSDFILPAEPPSEEDLALLIEASDTEVARLGEMYRKIGILYQLLSQPNRWDYLDSAIDHLILAGDHGDIDPSRMLFLGLSKAGKAQDPDVGFIKKIGLATEGFKLMDQAVSASPENFSLRLLRGKASIVAPGILGRKDSAAADRAFVERQLGNDKLPVHLRTLGLVFLGDAFDKIEKDRERAVSYWQQAASLSSPYAETAVLRLEGKFTAY